MTNTPLNPDAIHQLFAVAMMEVLDAEKLQPGNRLAHVNDIQEVLNRLEKNILTVAQPVVNSVEELDQLPPHTVIEEHEQGHGVLIKRGPRSWECLTHYVSGLPSGDIDLPARVLYRPEVK